MRAPPGVHGVDHTLPSAHLGFRIDPRCVDVSDAKRRNSGRIANQQPAAGRTLRVVVDHQITGYVAFFGAHPRQGRENDAVVEFERTDVDAAEKSVHIVH